jgi:hypothetical protein
MSLLKRLHTTDVGRMAMRIIQVDTLRAYSEADKHFDKIEATQEEVARLMEEAEAREKDEETKRADGK